MLEGLDLGTLTAGGGVAGAAALVIVTLLKSRSGDKETVIKTQQQHMERLAAERNEAIKDRDQAYDDADGWRSKYEAELRARIDASAEAQTQSLTVRALERQVMVLSTQVGSLTAEVQRLKGGA